MFNCPKHGKPYRVEEQRDYPGKTLYVCDECQAEQNARFASFVSPLETKPLPPWFRRVGVVALALLSSWMV